MVVAVVGLVLALNGDDDKGAGPTSSSSSSSSSTTTSTTAPPSSSSSQPPTGTVPDEVTTLVAGPGGGSGEIEVRWSTVAGATGYRITRAHSAGGPFSPSADLNVVTGATTKESGVMNLYVNGSSVFYVGVFGDGTSDPHWYFRVTAYNGAGEGPVSGVVCGAPVGIPAC